MKLLSFLVLALLLTTTAHNPRDKSTTGPIHGRSKVPGNKIDVEFQSIISRKMDVTDDTVHSYTFVHSYTVQGLSSPDTTEHYYSGSYYSYSYFYGDVDDDASRVLKISVDRHGPPSITGGVDGQKNGAICPDHTTGTVTTSMSRKTKDKTGLGCEMQKDHGEAGYSVVRRQKKPTSICCGCCSSVSSHSTVSPQLKQKGVRKQRSKTIKPTSKPTPNSLSSTLPVTTTQNAIHSSTLSPSPTHAPSNHHLSVHPTFLPTLQIQSHTNSIGDTSGRGSGSSASEIAGYVIAGTVLVVLIGIGFWIERRGIFTLIPIIRADLNGERGSFGPRLTNEPGPVWNRVANSKQQGDQAKMVGPETQPPYQTKTEDR